MRHRAGGGRYVPACVKLPLDVHFRFSLQLWGSKACEWFRGLELIIAGTDERNMLLPFAFTSISNIIKSCRFIRYIKYYNGR